MTLSRIASRFALGALAAGAAITLAAPLLPFEQAAQAGDPKVEPPCCSRSATSGIFSTRVKSATRRCRPRPNMMIASASGNSTVVIRLACMAISSKNPVRQQGQRGGIATAAAACRGPAESSGRPCGGSIPTTAATAAVTATIPPIAAAIAVAEAVGGAVVTDVPFFHNILGANPRCTAQADQQHRRQ